jgi:hypothetical protein
LKIIDWNIAHRDEPWYILSESDADLALLQEAGPPPEDIAVKFDIDPSPWRTAGAGVNRPWRTAVVRLKKSIGIEWIVPKPISVALRDDLPISREGTLAAAIVTPAKGEPVIVVSMYAVWEKPHKITKSGWIYADGSAHRVISDLSALVGQQSRHRIIAAGDLNVLYGYGEHGNDYWASRYNSIFMRMKSIGLTFIGPQTPNGRQAEPWPEELPMNSSNVPTYHTNRQTPATATRQLDFVFASDGLVDHVKVSAMNEPENWGPSDHCQIEIDVT